MENHSICINPECSNYLGVTHLVRGRFLKNTLACSAITFFMLFSFDDFSMEQVREMPEAKPVAVDAGTPDDDKVQTEMQSLAILCPEVVLAQIKLESGNYTSKLFRKTNNLLGMRYPAKRKTAACGIYIPSRDTIITGTQAELKKYSGLGNYAVYKSWKECIADYKLWQLHNYNMNKHYISFLGNIYAQDSLYKEKLSRASGVKTASVSQQ